MAQMRAKGQSQSPHANDGSQPPDPTWHPEHNQPSTTHKQKLTGLLEKLDGYKEKTYG